jgi:hypothetical protein
LSRIRARPHGQFLYLEIDTGDSLQLVPITWAEANTLQAEVRAACVDAGITLQGAVFDRAHAHNHLALNCRDRAPNAIPIGKVGEICQVCS